MPEVPPTENVAPLAVVAAVESTSVVALVIVEMVVPGAMPGPVTAWPVKRPAVGMFRFVELMFPAVLTAWLTKANWPPAPCSVVVPPLRFVAPK